MSWSVNLNGPKEVVRRELADAILLFDKALYYAENTDAPIVNVNLNGYVSWVSLEGNVTASNVGFSFGEAYPVIKDPEPEHFNNPQPDVP